MKNKGFSLVELVVVILILGVLAAGLAPQVMKWAGRAQESADIYSERDLVTAVQICVGDYEGQGTPIEDAVYNVTSAGFCPVGADPNTGFIDVMEEYFGGNYSKVQDQKGKIFQIRCRAGGSVEVAVVDGTY